MLGLPESVKGENTEMIPRLLVLVLISIASISATSSVRVAYSEKQEPCSQNHEAWVVYALEKMETIKPGMTREELLRVFATEGGFSERAKAQIRKSGLSIF
jgi:hypothetical protein